MKKPYLEKITKISDFDVWLVDGVYIRKKIEREFTNFGQHYRFKFIPEKEFWIDKEEVPGEEDFYIEHMLIENRLMSLGMEYKEALAKADDAEKKMRKKIDFIQKGIYPQLRKKEYLPRIHKKLLLQYSRKVQVWIIDGRLVRDLFFIDFTEGGHDKVYKFIPKEEVWLDDDLSEKEIKFVLLHERYERNLMSAGWDYPTAHRKSSSIEYHCRRHPEDMNKKLAEVINKNL